MSDDNGVQLFTDEATWAAAFTAAAATDPNVKAFTYENGDSTYTYGIATSRGMFLKAVSDPYVAHHTRRDMAKRASELFVEMVKARGADK